MSETYELTYDENHRSPMRRNHRSPMIHYLRIHVVRHTNKRFKNNELNNYLIQSFCQRHINEKENHEIQK